MKKILFISCLLLLLGGAAFAAAPGDFGARGGTPDATPPINFVPEADMSEGFEDITTLGGSGWSLQNQSGPLGVTDWFQGNDAVFAAHAGATDSYIGANFNNTTGGTGVISNWLITPELNLAAFDTMSFWTRTVTGNIFPDRLEVRLSTNGASTNVGTLATDVGDFTDLLIEINPGLAVGGYPQVWTQFTVTAGDLPTNSGTGRVGLRYFVTGAGPAGTNSNYIGIDTWDYVERLPSALEIPTVGGIGLALLGILLGLGSVALMRRRSRA